MSDNPIHKEYSNGEVTITWEPHKCIHSKNCIAGLATVFNFESRPWVNADGASTEAIVKQIDKCPSAALGYYFAEQKEKSTGDVMAEQLVEAIPNGPLMVYGNLKVKLPNGHITNQSKVSAFCRCGASQNKPFCDGTHKKINFEG
ncbi:(4Fe-4S)-binding protein [Algoriphagus chordae]|uniref:Putative Fe-S cluster protein YjdI n=1 Tax=Algoriphagus chordae TaxID=237019 RepID=A0A2W7RJQ6_9BACT|nr:(4Fe-4S)-binding protein [Algoriphagus chordae]PZX55797.1 putative Fe-S cluster protein YjdI [Algoriphagus chordae]